MELVLRSCRASRKRFRACMEVGPAGLSGASGNGSAEPSDDTGNEIRVLVAGGETSVAGDQSGRRTCPLTGRDHSGLATPAITGGYLLCDFRHVSVVQTSSA
jgi:hypothetical protein